MQPPARSIFDAFPRPRSTFLFAVLALIGVAYWAYRPALSGLPVWDDEAHLTAPALRSFAGLARIWCEPGATQQYYPVLHTAFWLEQRLWGDAVLGYHVANLAQHLLAAGLLALLLDRWSVPGAGLAAALFVLHPVHVESVAWISEQKNTLSLLFYLGAALAHQRFCTSRSRGAYALGLSLFLLALLTKSVTATLPAALLVVRWWRQGRLSWRDDALPLVPWLLLGAGAGLFTAWMEQVVIGASGAAYELTFLQRTLLAGRVLWFYVGHFLLPLDLTFLYPRWTIDPASVSTWLPLLAAAVLTLALWTYRTRSRAPLAAWLCFGGTLFPVLGFLNVYPFRYSYVADHFQYLPNLALVALTAAGLTLLSRNWHRAVRIVLGIALLGALASLTARQTPMYRDSETLYRATLARNPECWMAHNNLGLILSARGEKRTACWHFRQAIALHAEYFDGLNNLGLALTQLRQHRAAIPYLQRAIRVDPCAPQARNNLGIALAASGKPREAVAAFRGALHFMPDSPSLYDNLSKALRLDGRTREAAAAAAQATRLRARAATTSTSTR